MNISKTGWLGLAALVGFFWWLFGRKAGAEPPPGGITVDVQTLPTVTVGGLWQAWTLVTNTTQVTRIVNVSISGAVGTFSLSFNPSMKTLTLSAGATGIVSDFWFTVPEGTSGLSGQVTVVADGATDTATFVVG